MKQNPHIKIELRYGGVEKRITIKEDSCIVGRSDKLKASLPECQTISREHLKVEFKDDEIWLTDLGSSNGTHLNRRAVKPHTAFHYKGEALCVGTLDDGAEVFIQLDYSHVQIDEELIAKKEELAALELSIQKLNADLERIGNDKKEQHAIIVQTEHSIFEVQEKLTGLEEEFAKLTSSLETLTARHKKKSDQVTDVRIELVDLKKSRKQAEKEFEEDTSAKKDFIDQLQAQLDDLLDRKVVAEKDLNAFVADAENIYSNSETKITEIRAKLLAQKEEFEQKSLVHKEETEKLENEAEQLRKKFKLETENLESEGKLKRSYIEREIEEIKTQKIILERDYQTCNEELGSATASYKQLLSQKAKLDDALKLETSNFNDIRSQYAKLETQKKSLEQQIVQSNDVLRKNTETAAQIKASAESLYSETKKEAQVKAKQLIDKVESDIANQKKHASLEIERMNIVAEKVRADAAELAEAEIAETRKQTSVYIEKAQSEWTQEYQTLKSRAEVEYKSATELWNEELSNRRAKDTQELQHWKASEEKRVHQNLAKHVTALTKQVVSKTIAVYSSEQSVSVPELVSNLEKHLKDALIQEATDQGVYNPNLKKDTKKFWFKTAGAAAAVVAVTFGVIFGPKIMSENIDKYKVANKIENEMLMKQVRDNRERMLTLKLEVRQDFQESYVDNILYNPGYLALKQDEVVKKEWTIYLSEFFFQELLYDDRKVVEYLPIESAMIQGLAETYQVLNTKNFAVNLPVMKKFEEGKIQEMWLAVGGKDNWQKLRRREAEFYAKHMGISLPLNRVPAASK